MCGFCNKAKNKGKKKGQSAMEYLMTYGWALLVVMIVLGVLFYLGVFTPKTTSACTFDAGTTYVGSKASGGTLQLVLGNGPYSVTDSSAITISGAAIVDVRENDCAGDLIAAIGTNIKYCVNATLTPAKAAGSVVTTTVAIPYTDSAGLTHNMTGTCNIRAE